MADTSATFRLLADRTRRRLLFHLLKEESVDVSEEILVRSASETTSSHATQQQLVEQEPLRASTGELYHNHLPKLQSHGMIEWDRDTQTVSRGEAFEEVEPILRLMSANSHALPTGLL